MEVNSSLESVVSRRNATVKVPRDLESLEFKMVTAGAIVNEKKYCT